MKKIIKSRMFYFILGFIIAGSVGVYAATQYNASQITYNKNGKATVDAALNDLYSKKAENDYSNKTYTQEGLSVYSDRVSIESGGYYVDSNNVTWVNLKLKTKMSFGSSNIWLLITGLPNMTNKIVFSDTTNRFSFVSGNFDNRTGRIDIYTDYYASTIPRNTEMILQFKY